MVSLLEFSLRSILLALSFYGYLQVLSKQIRIEIAVSLLLSSIGSLLFVAGMQNMLQETTFLVFSGGVYLACRSVRKKESPFALLSPGVCFFFAGSAVLLYFIYGVKFEVYDDFSHWATAAKVLAQYDRFPNATNTDISFTSYPLGTASFIYYITKIVGISSEWIQCYTQNILILSMILSIFAFVSNVYALIAAVVISVFMVVSNAAIVTLCVDTLLTVTAVAAFSFCLYYKEELQKKIWYLLPYAVFLIIIKNSGIIFAVFLYMYVAYCFLKSDVGLKTLFVHMLITVAVLFFWQKHVDLVYNEGMMGRHSLSLSYSVSVFGEKTQEELLYTIRSVLESTFSLSNRMVYLIAIGFPVLLVLSYVLKIDTSPIKQVYAFTVVFYLIYQIGLLGMYLFNMPSFGAWSSVTEPLPSYIRYHDMMVDFAAGLFCICTFSVMSQFKVHGNLHILQALVAVSAIVVMFYTVNPYLGYYIRYTQPGGDRQKMDTLIEDYHIQKDRRYFVLISDERNDGGYLENLARYLLEPRDMAVCSPDRMEIWLEYNCLKLYDYYILYDQTPETVAFFEENFQTSESVICTSKY